MAKKTSNAQLKVGTVSAFPQTQTESEPSGASVSELQQIQNLLFGSQTREIDNNLLALEQRFDDKFDKMCKSYEAQIKTLKEAVDVLVKNETAARLASYKAVAVEIESVRTQTGKAMSELQEQQVQAKQSTDKNLDAAITKLDTQCKQQNSQLATEVKQNHNALDKSKVNKKMLSKLLSNLATEFE